MVIYEQVNSSEVLFLRNYYQHHITIETDHDHMHHYIVKVEESKTEHFSGFLYGYRSAMIDDTMRGKQYV